MQLKCLQNGVYFVSLGKDFFTLWQLICLLGTPPTPTTETKAFLLFEMEKILETLILFTCYSYFSILFFLKTNLKCFEHFFLLHTGIQPFVVGVVIMPILQVRKGAQRD